jgi:hypothetical protein
MGHLGSEPQRSRLDSRTDSMPSTMFSLDTTASTASDASGRPIVATRGGSLARRVKRGAATQPSQATRGLELPVDQAPHFLLPNPTRTSRDTATPDPPAVPPGWTVSTFSCCTPRPWSGARAH